MSKWKIIREADDPIALRLSIGSPPEETPDGYVGYIVYRGDTEECLNLLEQAVQELKKFYGEQGE